MHPFARADVTSDVERRAAVTALHKQRAAGVGMVGIIGGFDGGAHGGGVDTVFKEKIQKVRGRSKDTRAAAKVVPDANDAGNVGIGFTSQPLVDFTRVT